MLPQEVIRHKRDGQKLSKEEIEFFIKGITDWSVSECQIAAFSMAVCLKGMDDDETSALTESMAKSGEVLNWSTENLNGPVVDKHSTGGVGDKTSLVLAPLIAACGGYVPMIAGRGLGHTGGTLDKLDSIPGYVSVPSTEEFKKVTREVGCALIGQTGDLAPADKRLYAVRDVTASVESIPLIASSILSKKMAEGLDALVTDLKCGNGAFMPNIEEARKLARTIVRVAKNANMPTRAVLTDMNQVLGKTAGNAVEVAEAVGYLKGEYRDSRLTEIVTTLGTEALLSTNLASSREDAVQKMQKALDGGHALEKFAKMVAALGGPADFTDDVQKYLPQAPVCRPVYAQSEGYLFKTDTRGIGTALIVLGGQRRTADQRIDYSVGLTDVARIGEYVDKERPLAVIRAADEETFAEAAQMLQNMVQISPEAPSETSAIIETITE